MSAPSDLAAEVEKVKARLAQFTRTTRIERGLQRLARVLELRRAAAVGGAWKRWVQFVKDGNRAPMELDAAQWTLHAKANRRDDRGRTRVIQRRFNVSIPRARVLEKTSTLRDRSER